MKNYKFSQSLNTNLVTAVLKDIALYSSFQGKYSKNSSLRLANVLTVQLLVERSNWILKEKSTFLIPHQKKFYNTETRVSCGPATRWSPARLNSNDLTMLPRHKHRSGLFHYSCGSSNRWGSRYTYRSSGASAGADGAANPFAVSASPEGDWAAISTAVVANGAAIWAAVTADAASFPSCSDSNGSCDRGSPRRAEQRPAAGRCRRSAWPRTVQPELQQRRPAHVQLLRS